MDAASLRYAAGTEKYADLQLEFSIACRLRSEIVDARGRVFAFRFLRCAGIYVACRQWEGDEWHADDLPLLEALHEDALKPLNVDYFLMKSSAELPDLKPRLAGGRWMRGSFEGFEAALDRGGPCFWMKAGGTGPDNSAIDCTLILACDEYTIVGFDTELPPEEFVAIGERWSSAWREYWNRRRRG